jgi:drug/metabolite transporter (DMT)-like permease
MHLFYVFASAVSIAVYYVYLSRVMKQRHGISSTLVLASSHLVSALAIAPLFLLYPQSLGVFSREDLYYAMVMTACLLVMSRQLYYYAYARTDVAHITVFSALTPIYTLATGFWFFSEFPQHQALIGLLLICVCIYWLFYQRPEGCGVLMGLAQPFALIIRSKPVFCAFLSTIPTAFAAAYQKQLMHAMDPLAFSFMLFFLIGIMSCIICSFFLKWSQVVSQLKSLPIHFYLMSALLMPLSHMAFCMVISYHQTAISLVLQRSSILFQIVLAYFFLKERRDIKKRIMVGIGIVIGLVLIIGSPNG